MSVWSFITDVVLPLIVLAIIIILGLAVLVGIGVGLEWLDLTIKYLFAEHNNLDPLMIIK